MYTKSGKEKKGVYIEKIEMEIFVTFFVNYYWPAIG